MTEHRADGTTATGGTAPADPELAGAPDDGTPSLSYRLQGAYAGAARSVGKVLVKAHVLPAQAPSRDHRLKHWMVSLTKVYDSLALSTLDVPWWTYRAIDVVQAWLAGRPRPIRVFEYGTGASTLWLADKVDEIYTVEHHRGFAEMMEPVLAKKPTVTLLRVPAVRSDAPRITSSKPGHEGLDFYDYVHAIDGIEGDFDLIVVDGRAREACLTAAIPRLAPGGVIVYDNSLRGRYAKAIAASGLSERRLRGLTPTLPYPDQTSLLTKPGESAL